jgi:hypothetical protein
MTNISGTTTPEGKKTVRDRRARPKLVLYNWNLAQSMPRMLSLTSSFNALSHSVEVTAIAVIFNSPPPVGSLGYSLLSHNALDRRRSCESNTWRISGS